MTEAMEELQHTPMLITLKSLQPKYKHLERISLTKKKFTLGRCLQNHISIPFLAISRFHCVFTKLENDEWFIEDFSTYGIRVNKEKLVTKIPKLLTHEDIITLEPAEEFVYKFILPQQDVFGVPTPRKRIKLEPKNDNSIINNVKMKFEQSQNDEIKHIEDKILSAKQLQKTSTIMKQQLQHDMDRKIQQLETEFAQQIENLKGEKNEVENQKASLIEERDAQLAQVKSDMEGKIAELMEQIKIHNETESELFKENTLLKENLQKEREEFLLNLSRENSSKQEMLNKLEAKIQEQEEVRLKEKQELQEILKRETEQLILAKEKEFKKLEEQKRLRELELEEELHNIKKHLQEQMKQTEQQRLKAEEQRILQMDQMKKLSDEDKIKMAQLQNERQIIEKQLGAAHENAEKSLSDLRQRVEDREAELAALAAERIQQQDARSSKVISTLQEQLEGVRKQLQSVETEKNILLENVCDVPGEGTSKQSTLMEVGELMESELQCSICSELFIEATTLNCSHTYCKYCITRWKKKKKDCPICRTFIKAENRSLVLDTFIEKMVENLTEEMKSKRQDILKSRAELVSKTARETAGTSRGSSSHYESEISSFEDEEDYEDYEATDWQRITHVYDRVRHSHGRSYNPTDANQPRRITPNSANSDDSDANLSESDSAEDYSLSTGGRRWHDSTIDIPSIPGAFYGAYGRCFRCGARGHWAAGCPFR